MFRLIFYNCDIVLISYLSRLPSKLKMAKVATQSRPLFGQKETAQEVTNRGAS